MAEIPANILPSLQTWWASLEGGTQGIFEAIYIEAPAAVSRALSGGTWVADGPEPGLAAQLGTAFNATDEEKAIPRLHAKGDQLEITPFHAGIGQKVTVKWTEVNDAEAPLGAYFTDIYVTDPNGEQVGGARLEGAGVAAGGTVERSWDFHGGATPGTYAVVAYLNSEGAERGSGVPGPQGYRTSSSAQFDIGGGEGAARDQDMAAWDSAMGLFKSASSSAMAPELVGGEVLTDVRDGVNWLASLDGLTAQEQKILGELGTWISGLARQENPAPIVERLAPGLATVGGLAHQGRDFSTPELREPMLDALKALMTS